ncbi:transglutaminase domain-containing protein [Glycomyces terrestris]|uniref:Transglutaminase domain-containing protein n=1 Tax=Glycomyces terrestris TaxID=2493553 RepID=A0A426UV61_9ACTN|nr:transglutaminase-like domain-containing protein [Glycomyces terrestris]RRR98133.1 transglutaminase domain-containing protein [Glycomyces terrestris]
MTTDDALDYYTRPGPFTDPGAHRDALLALPRDVPSLLEAVQGLLIHVHLTWAYEVEHRPEHSEAANVRRAEDLLGRLLADGRPLTEPRPPHERLGGTCRHFTVLTVAALRAAGVPARARCGFGEYFPGPSSEDHWVAEFWHAEEVRWVLADAQIDARQRELFGADLDTADVPRDGFVVAGDAWRRCRAGEDDPDRFGLNAIGEFGDWWIAANLIRDVAALSNVEMLPWDVWGAMPEPGDEIGPELVGLLDRLAALTADPATAAEAREWYGDDRLRVPAVVLNANLGREEPVALG